MMGPLARSRHQPQSAAPAPRTRAAARPATSQSDASRRLALHFPAGSGAAPEASVRRRVESSFGADLSGTQIHTGPSAARLTHQLNASAVAIGNDVAFAPGKYRPGTEVGNRLIAHELAHVVQSRQGTAQRAVSRPTDASELEADEVAGAAAHGLPVTLAARPSATVHRKRMSDAADKELKALAIPSTKVDVSGYPIAEYFKVMSSGNFSTRELPPSGLTVELGGIDDAYKTPMTSIAMKMASTTYSSPATGATKPLFGPGQTVMVHLELKKHGLADADYRFTWTGKRDKGTLYIETATGPPADQNKPAAEKPADGEIPATKLEAGKDAPSGTRISTGSLNFSLKNTWSAGRFAHLKRALELVPADALKVVDGLEFEVRSGSGTAGEDGHYDDDEHRVVMFSSAWESNAARYGGLEWPVYAIAHEIGHAIDRAPLRRAWTTYESSQGGTKAEKKLTGARSESGGRYVKKDRFELEVPLGGKDESFRKAAIKDGIKVAPGGGSLSGGATEYSNEGWEDVYAEAFALYTTDPDLLKQIRPATYAYFEKKYPRKP